MVVHGYTWLYRDIHGYTWEYMDIHGSTWKNMEIHGFISIYMGIFGHMNEGVVSKETVVLRRWGSSIQEFGFINGVDNVNWPPYRDSKS